MTAKESIFGVGFCVFFILCILNPDIITFILFYVFPFAFFSFIGNAILVAGTGDFESEDGDTSIDYRGLTIKLFIIALVAVLVISLADRAHDLKGYVIRALL